MNTLHNAFSSAFVVALLATSLVGTAFAGTASIMNGKDVTDIEYSGDKLRMDTDDKGEGYMVIRDGRMFVVTGETVMDASAMMSMFGGAIPDPGPSVAKVEDLRKTSRSETVAGIRGEVWEIRYLDDDGRPQTSEVVLSKDARAREFQQAMGLMTRTLLQAAGKDTRSADVMLDEFEKRNRGMLRMGDEFRVSALTDQRVAQDRFNLPSEPVSLPGFGSNSVFSGDDDRAAASDEGRGLKGLGGLFGKKAERQQGRIEDRTEAEVDEATDSAVDKALNKAFDKLFGN
nr:hypothetical protein [Oceanococcus sp. HetDA_MAG_MS8]